MIKELTMYTVVCDECGKHLDVADEIIAWQDKGSALDIAMEADWLTIDDKHYCPYCYYHDEDDKLIIQKFLKERNKS